MRLYIACQGKTISLPLTCTHEWISRPDWVEEVIPHLEDEHNATLSEWLGDEYKQTGAWQVIAYQYTDGNAVSGSSTRADGSAWSWVIMLYGEPTTRAELRAHLNPTIEGVDEMDTSTMTLRELADWVALNNRGLFDIGEFPAVDDLTDEEELAAREEYEAMADEILSTKGKTA